MLWRLPPCAIICSMSKQTIRMNQVQFRAALKVHSLSILAALSRVHIRTLQKIRDGWHDASPGTIDRVQPIIERLERIGK